MVSHADLRDQITKRRPDEVWLQRNILRLKDNIGERGGEPIQLASSIEGSVEPVDQVRMRPTLCRLDPPQQIVADQHVWGQLPQ
ncbi:hypothetical protein AB0J47_18525 [Nocardia sp. NPDC049737]|uniref:hypothetical protein n=1 Tax=Nocardia sp. NPDC049737 TaxID=3154358 RepID=UPI00342C2810